MIPCPIRSLSSLAVLLTVPLMSSVTTVACGGGDGATPPPVAPDNAPMTTASPTASSTSAVTASSSPSAPAAATAASTPSAAPPSSATAASSAAPPAPAGSVGFGTDAHGCRPSAGYLWCQKDGKCERPFELAKQKGWQAQPGPDGGAPSTKSAFDTYCNN
jgi:hypothetical protein